MDTVTCVFKKSKGSIKHRKMNRYMIAIDVMKEQENRLS
jgi:hypothetical protein